MTYRPSKGFLTCVGLLLIVLFLFFGISPRVGSHKAGPKAYDLSNIRSFGQASLIYASDHNDQLPRASDIWDYMRQIAEDGLLNDASILCSRIDPAADFIDNSPVSILAPEQAGKPHQLNPAFLQTKPSLAVALGDLNARMPTTMPIAWTRSLQIDGSWAKYGPYGADGGYIVFLGGNVQFYHNLTDDGGKLTRFDGKGKTANILESLPPGSRIGEYTPTAEEQTAWAKAIESQHKRDFWRDYLPPELWPILVVWTSFTLLAFHRLVKKRKGVIKAFIWAFIATILWVAFLIIVQPMC